MNKKINIPDVNSDWGTIAEFALTFSGYNYVNGGPMELSLLWDKCAKDPDNASLDDLRSCLFWIQRAGRFCGDEGSDDDLEEARELLRLMHAKK